jgi:Reverse transcriptase (RNA-dependent DNA polymerase)
LRSTPPSLQSLTSSTSSNSSVSPTLSSWFNPSVKPFTSKKNHSILNAFAQPFVPISLPKSHLPRSSALTTNHYYQYSNAISFFNYSLPPSSSSAPSTVSSIQITANPVEVPPMDITASFALTASHHAQADVCSIWTSPSSSISPAPAEVLLAQADTISPHTPIVLHLAQADAIPTSLQISPSSATLPAPAEVLPTPADAVSLHTSIVLHSAQANAIPASSQTSLLSSATFSAPAEVLLAQADTKLFHNITARPNTEQLFQLVTSTDSPMLDPDTISCTQKIQHHLQNYPNSEFTQTLIGITTYGARVGFVGSNRQIVQSPNHSSIHNHMEVIDNYIEKEILAGRVHEIKDLPPTFFCSPLGLVPKKRDGVQTGWRMIFDLSCPDRCSVNDGIPKEFGTLKYESFSHALRIVAEAGPNSLLLKKDLQAAFRRVKVSPLDWHLFIFHWRGKYYVDTCLPFGLRTAPRIYNLFAEGIHWALQHNLNWNLSHYVDDFLGVFPPTTNLLKKSQDFDQICADFGFPTEPNKDEMGTQVNHLGFEINTISMTARLSENKRNRAFKLLLSLVTRKTVSANTLENLLGFLNHCCEVIPIGRPFLRHLFNTLAKANASSRVRNPYHYARISKHTRRDILWWLIFLNHWSCISIIQIKRPFHEIWTDASGTKGIGGIYLDHSFAAHVPRRHRKKHINWKEMYAILYAFLLWHSHWENGELLVHCDNQAVVDAINKRSIRGPTITPLQTLLLIAALFNTTISAVWIPTASNSIADALSRHDFKRLANMGIQYNHHIRRSEPLFPIQILRQKLHSYSKRASQNQQESLTMTQSQTMPNLRSPMATNPPSLPRPSLSLTGSHISSKLSKSKLHKVMSAPSRTTISNTNTQNSTTPLLIASSKVENVYTTKTLLENDSHLQRTSSSEWSPISVVTTTSLMTTPIFTPHCALDLPHSYEQGNSLGNTGILFRLLDSIYLDDTLPSTLAPMALLPSSSPPPKPILSQKVQKSTSRRQVQKSAQSPPFITYTNGSQHLCQLLSSVGMLGPSHDHTSLTESAQYFSKSEPIPANTQVTHFAKAPQSQRLEKESLVKKSNSLVDGKAMQSIYISTKSPNLITKRSF